MAQIDIDDLPDEIKSAIAKHQEEKAAAAAKGGGRQENLEVVIDLSDEAAVNRGLELGFLKRSDLDDDGGEGEGEGGEGEGGEGGKGKKPAEKTPHRKGYFDKQP